jgi:uncharacterized protein YjbI with pentapeptide repeats
MSGDVADFSGADLHGASLRDFAPTTHIYAVNVDLRRATLTNLDFTEENVPSTLRSSLLTCASLVDARLSLKSAKLTTHAGSTSRHSSKTLTASCSFIRHVALLKRGYILPKQLYRKVARSTDGLARHA